MANDTRNLVKIPRHTNLSPRRDTQSESLSVIYDDERRQWPYTLAT